MVTTYSGDVEALLRSGYTPLFLAPQAGVSESPFRRLCRDFGADVVVTEFVSADGVVKGTVRTRDYLRFDEAERPIGVQIFGSDPAMMAEAAGLVAELFDPEFLAGFVADPGLCSVAEGAACLGTRRHQIGVWRRVKLF